MSSKQAFWHNFGIDNATAAADDENGDNYSLFHWQIWSLYRCTYVLWPIFFWSTNIQVRIKKNDGHANAKSYL